LQTGIFILNKEGKEGAERKENLQDGRREKIIEGKLHKLKLSRNIAVVVEREGAEGVHINEIN